MTENKDIQNPKKSHEGQDSKSDESNSDESKSDEISSEAILEAIPEEDRGNVERILRQTMISGVMRRSNPIAEKITSEHITKLIDKSDVEDKRDRDERKSDKNYNLKLLCIGLIFIAFLIWFLRDNEDLLIQIIIGIISFVGGFGFGQSRKS